MMYLSRTASYLSEQRPGRLTWQQAKCPFVPRMRAAVGQHSVLQGKGEADRHEAGGEEGVLTRCAVSGPKVQTQYRITQRQHVSLKAEAE